MNKFDVDSINAIPMEDIARKYGRGVVGRGSSVKALCPWHDDHHPSLLVSGGSHNRCKCVSCGKGGDVIGYVMAERNMSFVEACETLSNDFGIRTIDTDNPYIATSRNTTPPENKQRQTPAKTENRQRQTPTHHRSAKSSFTTFLSTVNRAIRRPAQPTIAPSPTADNVSDKGFAYIPAQFVVDHLSTESSFCKCLFRLFDKERVEYAASEYMLGCYSELGNDDDVMFPSIDMEGYVRNIKVQHYCVDEKSERFFHKDEKHTYWLGKMLYKDQTFDSTTFFGTHLLMKYPETTVVLVESPKNAVVGTCMFPQYVWVAVGSKSYLTLDRLECMRGRKVIVMPDVDAIDDWRRILAKAKHIAAFEFSGLNDVVREKCGAKGDVGDLFIVKSEE